MKLLTWLDKRPLPQCASISMLLNLLVEILSRRSVVAGLGFLFANPLLFLYNAAIILLTLSVSMACKRRHFVLIFISVIWLGLGVANCVLLGFRTTPLAFIDFQLLKSVDSIITMYLNQIEIILISLAFLGLLAGIIIAWKRTPKKKPKLLAAISAVIAIAVFVASSTSFLVSAQALAENFGNLADAYKDYGFAYCFSRSLLDRGIDKPDSYCEEEIAGILGAIDADGTLTPELTPNIIMVQMESFFDVNYLEELSFSENPVPIFTKLKKSGAHGFLTVPSIGAGTANTEFEILTGMNLAYFGAGEYPYKSVLQKETCESICYNLRELGYTNHAIHNHEGTFYQRHVVFSNLGFDTYTSLEYMNNVGYTPIGWAKDAVLSGEVVKALASTPGQDFVYAITVQAHGKFPQEATEEMQPITVAGIEEEKTQYAFEYFVNQLHETDAFISALISELEAYKEPVVLVMFGDHLPSLGIENEDLLNGDRFETEYAVWSNFPLKVHSQDLRSYQLSAYILQQLGINNGILTKLHQTLSEQENYQAALELMEYDMVCGEHIAYGGISPHLPTELQMGVSEIKVSGIRWENENAYVLGEGFTEWSQVIIDGNQVNTMFIDGKTLMIAAEEIVSGADLVVAQIGDKTILSETNIFQCP